ncbi:MAG: transcription termination/antitermination protein NusG [Patescibacteria group bacterium]
MPDDLKELQKEAEEELHESEVNQDISSETVQTDEQMTDQPEPDNRQQKTDNQPLPEAKLEERGTGSKRLSGHIVLSKTDNPRAHWYVVHTTSGHEARVAESLRQRIHTLSLDDKVFEILIPTQDRVVIRSGRKVTVKEKIFPGYLLVKMILDEDAWLGVRTTQGVTGFVGAGNKPTPLSNAEVENIEKFTSAPAARYKVRFSVGEAVKITDGPFAEFLGTINEMDEEKGKVKVMVSIFGRETPVELDFLQIAKV